MTTLKARADAARVDWHSYPAVYDLMTELNPAYQELVDSYRRFLATQWLHPDDLILDLGAGTGNFSLVAADEWPLCRVLHVDASEAICWRMASASWSLPCWRSRPRSRGWTGHSW